MRPISIAMLAAASIAAATNASAQVTFTIVPNVNALAADISSDGDYIAGQLLPGSAFRYHVPTATFEALHGDQVDGIASMSDDGTRIVSNMMDEGVEVPGLWEAGVGWTPIPIVPGTINVDGSYGSGFALSGDGLVAGGYFWTDSGFFGTLPFSWTGLGGSVTLPSVGNISRVSAANLDGSVLVGFDNDPVNGSRRPAVWRDGALTVLRPAGLGEVEGVTRDGTLAVGRGSAAEGAIVWSWDGAAWTETILGMLAGTSTIENTVVARGVSDDGTVIVGPNWSGNNPAIPAAFIWTPEAGMVNFEDYLLANGLDLTGVFDVFNVSAVSGDGTTFTGYGSSPDGFWRSFVVTVPLPCTADVTTQGAGIGDPGYGVPDGVVTGADINYFVNAWIAGDLATADITTQGAGLGDPGYGVPDGLVTGADINLYVNLWIAGCP